MSPQQLFQFHGCSLCQYHQAHPLQCLRRNLKKNIRSTVKKALTSRRSKIPPSPFKNNYYYPWLEIINHFEVERGNNKKIERKL